MIQSTDISLLAEALPFWEKLSSDEKNFLIENTGAVSYKKNSVIHTAEFECLGMLFVTERALCASICCLNRGVKSPCTAFLPVSFVFCPQPVYCR